MMEPNFQLTPNEVRGQQFGTSFRGFDRMEVESFRDRVATELDRLLRERIQIDERTRNAQEQLRAEAKQAAEREAEAVIREARAEGERIVDRARMDERLVRERAESAARQFAAYVAAFRALLGRQIAELDVLEGHTKTIIQVQSEALAASTVIAAS